MRSDRAGHRAGAGRVFGAWLGVCGALVACSGGGSGRVTDAAGPVGTAVPGDSFALTSQGRLLSFNRATPGTLFVAVSVSGLQSGETLVGIDVRPGGATPGELYGLTNAGRLYVLNPSTGAATLKSTLAADAADTTLPYAGLSGADFGLDFNPVPDRLRVVSNTGQNLRINVDTGATFTDTTLSTAGSATVRSGVTAAAYTNSFAAACRTTLFYIDSSTDQLLTTADPNAGVLSAVGALGVNADAVNAFEIVTGADGSNTAIAVLTSGSAVNLYAVNLTSGAATLGAAIGALSGNETVRGLAVVPSASTPAQAAGGVWGLSESGQLLSFNAAAPQKLCSRVAVSGLQTGETLLGIDVRPADGALYALGSSGRVYTLAASGAASQKAVLSADINDSTLPFMALDGTAFGVDFNPVPDRLRVVSNTGQNLRINVDSGVTITDTALNPAGSATSAAAYTNSFAGAGATTLYTIDTTNDRLAIQGRPSGNPNSGDLQVVGSLAIGDVQLATGFDIAGANNTALAAVTLAGATTSDLVQLDLMTGAATRVNVIGGGERLRGLAFAAVPVATAFAATRDNRLVGFKVTTPGTFDTSVPIGGLQGGENVAGLDFRPSSARLYALTDAGRVLIVDPATGSSTAAPALIADAADSTLPYTALSGTGFGVDFNPVADRLRTVTDSELNLRTNVDTGATTTDTALTRSPVAPPAPDASAAAYTRNFAGTTTTQLLVIDIASNALMLQSPPNDGVLTAIGLLDPVLLFDSTAAFDIAGGDDGLALAALQVRGDAQSSLYRVNLTTGAVTAIGPIGPAGTPAPRALAIRLQ
jgi:trimeric autotransporter adhesin